MTDADPTADPTFDTQADPDDGQAIVEVDSHHGPEDIWTALTSDEGLARWMGAGATIEPEVDGSIDVPDPATGRHRHGHVDHLESGERIDFTWWPVDDPTSTSAVSIELEPTVDGTRIRVTETATASATAAHSGRSHITGLSVPSHRMSGRSERRSAWAWRAATLIVVGACTIERDRIRA